MGGFGVKVQHFPLTLLVVLTTLTLPCERDTTLLFQSLAAKRFVFSPYQIFETLMLRQYATECNKTRNDRSRSSKGN